MSPLVVARLKVLINLQFPLPSWFKTMKRLLFITLILIMGCGQTAYEIPDTGATLEGSITYDGKPIPLALVIVRSETATADSIVREEGKYKVLSVPLGNVKIAVDTEAMRSEVISRAMARANTGPDGKAAPNAPAKLSFFPVPVKYADPDTSGITMEIKKGTNTLDITLSK